MDCSNLPRTEIAHEELQSSRWLGKQYARWVVPLLHLSLNSQLSNSQGGASLSKCDLCNRALLLQDYCLKKGLEKNLKAHDGSHIGHKRWTWGTMHWIPPQVLALPLNLTFTLIWCIVIWLRILCSSAQCAVDSLDDSDWFWLCDVIYGGNMFCLCIERFRFKFHKNYLKKNKCRSYGMLFIMCSGQSKRFRLITWCYSRDRSNEMSDIKIRERFRFCPLRCITTLISYFRLSNMIKLLR